MPVFWIDDVNVLSKRLKRIFSDGIEQLIENLKNFIINHKKSRGHQKFRIFIVSFHFKHYNYHLQFLHQAKNHLIGPWIEFKSDGKKLVLLGSKTSEMKFLLSSPIRLLSPSVFHFFRNSQSNFLQPLQRIILGNFFIFFRTKFFQIKMFDRIFFTQSNFNDI